jgi:hypothetical protein
MTGSRHFDGNCQCAPSPLLAWLRCSKFLDFHAESEEIVRIEVFLTP